MVERRPVPPDTAKHLRALQADIARAEEALKTAVADALKAGAGVRGVSRATGISTNTVSLWGRERGWPTAEQQRLEAEAKAYRMRWDAMIDGVRTRDTIDD